MRILGIDPGSRITGFGIIDNQPNSIKYIHSGSIKVKGENFPQRIGNIFVAVESIIQEYRPEQMSIENVFMSRNADSALKLGQAKAAAICAAFKADLVISEYAPREIKQTVVGKGGASKDQVQHMVKHLLALKQDLQEDEADGLAIAICHAQFYSSQLKTGVDVSLLKRRKTTGRRRS